MPNAAVYKSSNIEKLDDFYRNDPGGALSSSADLLAERSTVDAASEFAGQGNMASVEVGKFGTGWLDEDAQRVIKVGEIEAIRIASTFSPPAPIETFWVTGAGDDFELHIHEPAAGTPDARVHVFMFIPRSRGYGSTRAESSSWIVRIGDRDDVHDEAPREVLDNDGAEVFKIQVSGPRGPGILS
jgi:hypothetical protein